MNLKTLGDLVLISTLPALYLSAFFYGVYSQWRSNSVGRALFWMILSLAAVCTAFLINLIFGDYPGREMVRIFVYGFVSFTIWRWFFELRRIQKREKMINPPV